MKAILLRAMVGCCLLPVACSLTAMSAEAADVIVAEVDGESITAAELNDALSILPPEALKEILKPENRRLFVENFAIQKLLVNEFQRRKLDQSPKFVRMMDLAKNEVLLALLRENLKSEISVDDKEVREFYDSHRKDFSVPEKRRARHILVSDEKKAAEILKRLKAGAKFEAEARLHSQDAATAVEGGDLGWSERGGFLPEFSKVVFAMKAGELLDHPARTRFGWHLIRLDSITPESLPPFTDIQTEVRQRCHNERILNAIPDFIKRLKEQSSIKIYPDRLSSIDPAASKD